jgi:GTP cyclohydrolase II
MSHDEGASQFSEATLRLGDHRLANAYGEFDVHFFRDLAHDATAMAISCGDLGRSRPLLARVHSSCVTSECLMGCDCDCAEQLEGALATIAAEGSGIVFYLMQEGRGAGLTAKARDRMIVQASGNRVTTFEAYASMGLPADLRTYGAVAPMSRLLGIRAPIRLLTNNPDKAGAVAEALEAEKIEVYGTESIQGPSSPFNRDYLSAKHDSGHALDRPIRLAGALPPSPVRVFEPTPLPDDPQQVVTASYFLPIALPEALSEAGGAKKEVEWFRLSVLYDRGAERESILLSRQPSSEASHGPDGEGSDEPLVREGTVTMRLFDRLPGPNSLGRAALERALVAIRDRRRGAVLIRFDDRDHAEP